MRGKFFKKEEVLCPLPQIETRRELTAVRKRVAELRSRLLTTATASNGRRRRRPCGPLATDETGDTTLGGCDAVARVTSANVRAARSALRYTRRAEKKKKKEIENSAKRDNLTERTGAFSRRSRRKKNKRFFLISRELSSRYR